MRSKLPVYIKFDIKLVRLTRRDTKFIHSGTMKIRIKGNSLRLRLTKSEVALFSTKGSCSETIDFGASSLTYTLTTKEGITNLDANYTGNQITVYMPMEAKQNWYSSNRVGYSNTVARETGSELAILVEKDFICMDESTEDQSDNYPNPKLS